MKKITWLCMAALCMVACSQSDEPVIPQEVTGDDFEGPDGRIVVQIGAEGAPTAVLTRAPIEGTAIENLEFGIFAVNRSATLTASDKTNWTTSSAFNLLLMNVKAIGSNREPFDSGVHTEGNKLDLCKTDGTPVGNGGAVYYYPMQGGQNYDFYGYHPRQTDEKVSVSAGGELFVDFNLTGEEDLIIGKAPQAPQVNSATLYVDENDLNKRNDVGMMDGYNARYIRRIKLHNWIIGTKSLTTSDKKKFVPNIPFEHKLTRLNFQVITAQEQAGGSEEPWNDREEAMKLRVKDVAVYNIPNAVTWNVSQNTLSWSQSLTELTMKSTDAQLANTNVWETGQIKPQAYDAGKSAAFGAGSYDDAGYLLVKPGERSYTVHVTVVAPSSTGGQPQTQEALLEAKLANGAAFEAGKAYNIRIALYALQKVYLTASLTEWAEGENIYAPVE